MTDNVIEYFYSAHSAYAYLGAPTLRRIAQDSGWRIVHRPFDFLPVVEAAGAPGFKQRSAAHLTYFFGRELRRWAQWRDLPMIRHRPTHHDKPLGPASAMIMAAKDPDRLSFAILQAHWRDDADIADAEVLQALARTCGEDAAALLAATTAPQMQERFHANTEEAIARTVFGSPTYFVRGDMFYGQDRLEMLACAIATPFED